MAPADPRTDVGGRSRKRPLEWSRSSKPTCLQNNNNITGDDAQHRTGTCGQAPRHPRPAPPPRTPGPSLTSGSCFSPPPSSRRSVAAGLSASARARTGSESPAAPALPPARGRDASRFPGGCRAARAGRRGAARAKAPPARHPPLAGKRKWWWGFLLWRPLAVGGTATKCC